MSQYSAEPLWGSICNRIPVAQIPQSTSHISHNAPLCNRNVHMCAHTFYKMVHCGIFVWWIGGFVRWMYLLAIHSSPIMVRYGVSFVSSKPDLLSPLLCYTQYQVNSSLPGQNGRHFADDVFKSIFVNEEFCTAIEISLKFVHNGPIDNNPALV